MEKINKEISLCKNDIIMVPEFDDKGYRYFLGLEMVQDLVYPYKKICKELRKMLDWEKVELITQYKGEVFKSLNTIYVEPGLDGAINWETNFEYQNKNFNICYLARYDYQGKREVCIVFTINNIEIIRLGEILTSEYCEEKINELGILTNFLKVLTDGIWDVYWGRKPKVSSYPSFKQKFQAVKSVEETNLDNEYKKELLDGILK